MGQGAKLSSSDWDEWHICVLSCFVPYSVSALTVHTHVLYSAPSYFCHQVSTISNFPSTWQDRYRTRFNYWLNCYYTHIKSTYFSYSLNCSNVLPGPLRERSNSSWQQNRTMVHKDSDQYLEKQTSSVHHQYSQAAHSILLSNAWCTLPSIDLLSILLSIDLLLNNNLYRPNALE